MRGGSGGNPSLSFFVPSTPIKKKPLCLPIQSTLPYITLYPNKPHKSVPLENLQRINSYPLEIPPVPTE